ncbi:MAG: S8 family serine peptidase [Ignavibacteriales bacterium]|nr:S8 family serine peptidase [Ignavibacteriales bacterium]
MVMKEQHYAADNGAKIINCSWGGGGYFKGQEVINYATSWVLWWLQLPVTTILLRSILFGIVYVLSVAATMEADLKASFSNYGLAVISAPGVSIYSTWQNDTYTSGSGTSFSSPIVAGLGALVKS